MLLVLAWNTTAELWAEKKLKHSEYATQPIAKICAGAPWCIRQRSDYQNQSEGCIKMIDGACFAVGS